MPAHTIHLAAGLDGPQILVGLDVGTIHAPWGGPPGTWNALIDTGLDEHSDQVGLASPVHRQGTCSSSCRGIVWEETYFIGITIEQRLRRLGHMPVSSLEREDMRWRGITGVFSRPIRPHSSGHVE